MEGPGEDYVSEFTVVKPTRNTPRTHSCQDRRKSECDEHPYESSNWLTPNQARRRIRFTRRLNARGRSILTLAWDLLVRPDLVAFATTEVWYWDSGADESERYIGCHR